MKQLLCIVVSLVCISCTEGALSDYYAAWSEESAKKLKVEGRESYLRGVQYRDGAGVEKSYTEAVECFEKAAKYGDVDAKFELGVCYAYGRGVEQSDRQAAVWYRGAAEEGLAVAQNALGECYATGSGVKQSYVEAVRWYYKAAVQGCATAQYHLGRCWYEGQGTDQSYEEAMKWYRKAAEGGCDAAKEDLKWAPIKKWLGRIWWFGVFPLVVLLVIGSMIPDHSRR